MAPGAARADPLRARSLAEIDRLLTASADRFGVARIAEITRLDRLGLPAVSVIRRDPIGASVSVCTGKGDTVVEARVAGLAEALERYCAEPRGRLEIVTCPARELAGDALDPARLIPSPDADLERPIDWCRGARLDGSPVWVPVNAVAFPYLPSPTAQRLFAAHTHGLATGADRSEAIVHGLLECIERDGYARAVALASVGRGAEIPVIDLAGLSAQSGLSGSAGPSGLSGSSALSGPSGLSGPASAAAEPLARIRAAGLRVLLRDLTTDTAVPIALCVIDDGELAHMGIAAHLDPDRALRNAVLEAAQSRVTDLQGAREDLPPRDQPVDPWFIEPGAAPVIAWPDAAPVIAWPDAAPVMPWPGAAPRIASPGVAPRVAWPAPDAPIALGAALAALAARLAALTPPVEPVVVDLSLPGIDLAVVRVVAPGLETWAHDPSRIGPRARTWLTPR